MYEPFFAAGKDITKPKWDTLWLGAERSATTGQWVWADGSSAEDILAGKWASGQASATGDYLVISTSRSYSMLAVGGNSARFFVCEIDVAQ